MKTWLRDLLKAVPVAGCSTSRNLARIDSGTVRCGPIPVVTQRGVKGNYSSSDFSSEVSSTSSGACSRVAIPPSPPLSTGPGCPPLGDWSLSSFVGHAIVLIISSSQSWSRCKETGTQLHLNLTRSGLPRNPRRFCLHFSAFGQVTANSISTMRGRSQCVQ